MNEHRSLFWPLTLVAAGIIWLMIGMGKIPSENLWALTHIWPYVLIALGTGLILRGIWRPFGQIVTALVIIGAAGAVIFAPKLGWNDGPPLGAWNLDSGFGLGAERGSGAIKTETRSVSGFDKIDIDYPADVVIQQGASESLMIEADENLLPQLVSEVRDGTLHIENREHNFKKRVNPSQIVRITITVRELREVDFSTAGELTLTGLKGKALSVFLSGAGNVTLNNLELEKLTASLSGAGEFTTSGSASELSLTISGFGSFNSPNLKTETADIQISGAGSATLRVEKTLDASISGAGSVNYYGSPSVTRAVSGAGSVKQVGQ
ncbi:MAG: hypothetical protein HFACDABA_00311 [Anaerolineales bacterium]|nr:hypothetical protein [Anaerolineales bacterium]